MNIHPLHKGILTWRDASIHLGIVTSGVFIALMLEGFVQWSHHRHLVTEARANIRQEIANNARQADADLIELKQNEARLTMNLAQLEEISSTHQWHDRSLTYTLEWENLTDTAWRSARDTGALGFMTYKEVQDLAGVYGQEDIANTAALRLLEEESRAGAPLFIVKDAEKTSDANLNTIRTRTADALLTVRFLEQVLMEFKQHYQDALKDAR